MKSNSARWSVVLLSLGLSRAAADPVIDVGSRLELFADAYLIDRLSGGAAQRLNHPAPQEVSIVMDKPWEGNALNYVTVFQDGALYRMYYRGADVAYSSEGYRETHPDLTCYAESKDGIHWTKPTLRLFEFNGSRENNIVWMGVGGHNFAPTEVC